MEESSSSYVSWLFCDDSKSKLEAFLSKLLPLTISSLSSPYILIRNKVLKMSSHVNKRVKHQSAICLILTELWTMYTAPNAASMVRNFWIVYIEMAFERAELKEKEDIELVLVANVSKLPVQHQENILRIAGRVIGECQAREIDDEVAIKYGSISVSKDRELFIEFCLHTILYQMPFQGRDPVVKRGEELLKKKASGANLDDPNLIDRLFLPFKGTLPADNVPQESKVSPGNTAVKTKLMFIFYRSIAAANSFPATLQCIFGCIYESDDGSVSAPLDKVLNCMTSCIQVAHVNGILEQGKNSVQVFLISLSLGLPWTVKMSTFASIEELCWRLQKMLNDLGKPLRELV